MSKNLFSIAVESETPHTVVYDGEHHLKVEAPVSPETNEISGNHYLISTPNFTQELRFQNGPVENDTMNGITNEALLALLVHRTEILNTRMHSEFNDQALEHMKAALTAFETRTKDRIDRQVEGTENE